MDQQKEKEQNPMKGKYEENIHSIAEKMGQVELEEKHLQQRLPLEFRQYTLFDGVLNAENTKPNEINFSEEIAANKESEISPNLPIHRRLPLEMECEIFQCLKLAIQLKFICGMGWGIYGMFGPKIRALKKTKQLYNPKKNAWDQFKSDQLFVTIYPDELNVLCGNSWLYVIAKKGFAISGQHCRMDHFPGTILYYYEIIRTSAAEHCPFASIIGMDVHNTEEEINEGLHRERERHQGEDENGRRERYKNEFRFAFLVDCIYVAHMNDGDDGDIDFEAITEKLQLRHLHVKDHPLYGILMANKCGEEEVVQTFLRVLQHELFEPNLTLTFNSDLIEQIFDDDDYVLLDGFLNAMKGKITKKERETKEKEKAEKAAGKNPLLSMPYFPDRLPKLHTLRSLLATLMGIIECIIKTIKPKDYSTVGENYQIFTRAFGGLTCLEAFMYFAIRNGAHYLEAVKELPVQIKGKMHKIKYGNSSFRKIIKLKAMYGKLSEKVDYLHMIKYLAINSFGFTKEELPPNEPNEYRLYDNNKAFREYQKTLVARIAEKIITEYRASHSLSRKSVPELDEQLFQQIQLNVSRIGVVLQEEEANRHHNEN